MCCLIRPIDTPVVEPHNEFTESRLPKVPDDSEVQVPVKHDFSETFEREEYNRKTVGKGELHNIVTRLWKLWSQNVFEFILYYHLIYTDDKATDQPRVNVSQNPAFVRENNLKPIFHPFKYVDDIFPVYKQKKGGHQNTPYLLSTEDLLKWLNEKSIDLGMGDTCYPHFVPFTMDDFERNLYLYYFNGIKQFPSIEMKFKSRSADNVQSNEFLHNFFVWNAVRQHKDFKCWSACQDPWNPNPARKLYPNWKL